LTRYSSHLAEIVQIPESNVIKIDPFNFELYVLFQKLVRFFLGHSVQVHNDISVMSYRRQSVVVQCGIVDIHQSAARDPVRSYSWSTVVVRAG